MDIRTRIGIRVRVQQCKFVITLGLSLLNFRHLQRKCLFSVNNINVALFLTHLSCCLKLLKKVKPFRIRSDIFRKFFPYPGMRRDNNHKMSTRREVRCKHKYQVVKASLCGSMGREQHKSARVQRRCFRVRAKGSNKFDYSR